MSSKEYWMGQAIGEAIGRGAEVRQWVEYARKLEQAIVALKKGEAGQIAIKKAALQEIAKLDPNNPMLNKNYRKRIYDQAYAQTQND